MKDYILSFHLNLILDWDSLGQLLKLKKCVFENTCFCLVTPPSQRQRSLFKTKTITFRILENGLKIEQKESKL